MLTLGVTLLLLYAGAFTTTIKAGMVFLDWPLSNGSLNPEGWLSNQAMFAEHSHRLLGALVGVLTVGLAWWVSRVDPRPWAKRITWLLVALVVVQGLLGGFRVLLDSTLVAALHGCFGQATLCLLCTAVLIQSRIWFSQPPIRDEEVLIRGKRALQSGVVLIGVLFVQLVVAAAMRHLDAGLSIPTFPFTPEGSLVPSVWNVGIALNFSHRVLALLIFVLQLRWAAIIWNTQGLPPAVHRWMGASILLLGSQIALGASIVWTARAPVLTSLHVLNGALLLAVVWMTTLLLSHARLRATTARASTASGEDHRSRQSGRPAWTGCPTQSAS